MKPIYIEPFLRPTQIAPIESELLALKWETKRTARHEYFMADGKECPSCAGIGRFNDGVFRSGPDGKACVLCGGSGRVPVTYSYGRDDGITYTSKPWTPHVVLLLQSLVVLPEMGGATFNACFLNKYDDQHQHLGWHADDFEGMDPAAPIAVMSFGAEREIWWKDKRGFPCVRCGGTGKEKLCVACSECHGYLWTKGPYGGKQPEDHRQLLQRGSLFIMPPGFQDEMLHRIPKHDRPCGWRISLTFRKFL